MEVRTGAGGVVRAHAAAYSLLLDPAGPSLELRWTGGIVQLGAGAGRGKGLWTATAGAASEGQEIVVSADDGRSLRLDCREDLLFASAEVLDPGETPSLLAMPAGLPAFSELFSPEPTALRKSLFRPDERAVASVGSDLAYHRGHWIFSPPPFCFVLRGGDGGGLAVGVADELARLRFTSFEYDGGAFVFRFDRPAGGLFATPRLALIPMQGDNYRAVELYCDLLRREGLAPAGTGRTPAEWWLEPVFCGWGEQSYQRVRDSDYPTLGVDPGKADRYYLPDGIQSLSTQAVYEDALDRLDARGIDPGIVTIDDKWQIAYGVARPDESRWPDLKGFIERQHGRGRHVLLWWKLWDGEGLPPDELLGGWPYPVVDPAAPAYRKRVESEMQFALGELGGDGLKIDILHRGPTRAHMPSRGGAMGVSLHREMLALIRDAAIAAKDDALIVAHAANPYFADLADVIRLNDVSTIPGNPSFVEDMRHRARIAKAACPEALIDTDNWPCPDRRQWREYVATQPEIGIPALYYATGIDLSNEPLQPEDYALIRETWRRWRTKR